MPNEGPYGGKIEVRKDGSVLWQVEAREFPVNRDTDGTLEYAIRVVALDRNIFTSKDGKCLIHVYIESPYHRNQPLNQKFLIVSGYDAPVAGNDAVLVGRSYFVAEGHYSPNQTDEHYQESMPPYDLTLRYDDYDLDRAGLPLDLEPDKLSLCYQNRISVRNVLNEIKKTQVSFYAQAGISQEVGQGTRKVLELNPQTRDVLFAWADLERAMREAGMDADLKDILMSLLKNAGDQGVFHSDVHLSRWRRVRKHEQNQEHGEEIALRKAVDGEPTITALSIADVPGSRAISAKGLNQQGTFALMYHGNQGRPVTVAHSE